VVSPHLENSSPVGLRLEDIVKRHPSMNNPAVDEVSLTVQEGEFLTLLGPSGSGKSTLLGMIAGFSSPTSGRVILDGHDVTRIPPHRRNIGMVFQNYALFPHLSALDNVAFGLRRRGIRRGEAARRAQVALGQVDLEAYAQRRPHELSGGQQQRVAVARAIVFEPRLVLMDEPFGALDRRLREGMQLEMMRLHNELGTTFIFVTHDQEEALSMSDRIAVMEEGKLEQVGSPTELYEHPASRFVARFLGDSNLFTGRIAAPGVLDTDLGPLQVHVDTPAGDCTLLVRPENAHLVPERAPSPSASNHLSCVVEEIVYLGATRRIAVRFDTGLAGIVSSPARADGELRVGDRSYFAWDTAAAHLIEPTSASDRDMVEVG
jgi:putative spermidine/putrescine transport system ATP-binding protein